MFRQNYNVKNRTTIVTVLNVFKITQKDGVTKSALELISYKLHTLVIYVSSNFLCTVFCKILWYHLHSYVILHFNKHNYLYICLFFIRFTLPRGSSSLPLHPEQTDDIFLKIKTQFTHTNVYFVEHCTLTFFNILIPKISRIPKNNHIYIIHTLGGI